MVREDRGVVETLDGVPKVDEGDAVRETLEGANGFTPVDCGVLAEPKPFEFEGLEPDEGAKGDGEVVLALGWVSVPNIFDDGFGVGFAVVEKGLESVGVAVPAPKGVFISDGVALADEPDEPACCSIGGVVKRTCLLLCNPPRDEPLPLLFAVVPFCPLCSRFAAFSSRSFSNGSVVVALGDGVAKRSNLDELLS